MIGRPLIRTARSVRERGRCWALLGMLAWLGLAGAQTPAVKPTEAQKRVQQKLLQQKRQECAKQGKYAVATTIRGATLYKCAARPSP